MSTSAFTPVKRTRAVDTVIRQIRDRILDGTFTTGEMLPSAGDLAAQFDVSQRSISEALKVLETQGLIHVRMGVGSFVTRNDLDAFLTALTRNLRSYLSVNKADLNEVKDLRLILEGIALERAAHARDEQQIRALEESVLVQRKAYEDRDYTAYQQAHFLFHGTLMDGLGNRLISMIYLQVLNLLRPEMEKAGSQPLIVMRAIEEHDEMIRAIRNGATKAEQQALLNRHLEGFVRHLESAPRETPDG